MKLSFRAAMTSLLALLVTASALTACGGSEPAQTPTTDAPDAPSTQTETEAQTDAVIDWTAAGIDALDYGGEEFHFIVQNITADTYAWFMMDP